MSKKTQTDVRKLVDQLGMLKARIADLEEEEKDIRDQLVQSGEEEIDGRLFHCTITTTEVERTDWKEVVLALPLTSKLKSLIKKNRHTEDRTTVRVSSR